MEQRSGAADAAHALHGASAEVAHPHGHGEARGRRDRPIVGEVAARARLHGGSEGEVKRCLNTESGDARLRIGEHVEHERRRRRGHHPALLPAHRHIGAPADGMPHAAVGQRAIAVRHLQQRDVAVA